MARKQKTRSRRVGLLTENEIDFLKGKQKFSSKHRSKFLRTLLPRITACTNDLNLIFDARKKDNQVEGWSSFYFRELYRLSESIKIRNRLQFRQPFLGRVKFETKKEKRNGKGNPILLGRF